MESIDFYKEFGDLGYLANYSSYGFYDDGVFYKTVEHYYQANKFDNEEIRNKIINAETPKEASNIGRDRNNIRKDNFYLIKNSVMFKGLFLKFIQNKDIMYKLIETRDKNIREMTVKEYYWGVGDNKQGENNIGKILCNVRNVLKDIILTKIIRDAKKYNEVYIIGHRKPDTDSIFSSYLLSRVLNSLGIKAIPCVLNEGYEYIANDEKIISDYKKFDIEVINDIKDKKFILVDHNNLDGLDKDNVIGAIDHHIITNEVDNVLEMEYASTGLLIYDLFKNVYKFSNEEKEYIALTVLTDTEYLTSMRFTLEDKKIYDELKVKIDVEKLQKKYFKISDFSLPLDELLKTNYKEYDFNNKHILRSMISSYNDEYNKYYESIKNSIKDNWLLIWNNYEKRETIVVYENKEYIIDFFTTSTNLVLKELNKKGII